MRMSTTSNPNSNFNGRRHSSEPADSEVPEAFILLTGPTGSGKTTFANLISGSELGVGEELESCTNMVQLGRPFNLDGHRVCLIDTPGFDDTNRSNADILNTIALFLATLHKERKQLAGVLYFHPISDARMSGTSVKNFKMFRKLCGEQALQNIVIVTNMWGEVRPEVGEAREAELKRKDIFFRPVLEKGARMARHENTVPSAEKIIRLTLNNHPLPLLIQTELVEGGKDILETAAGRELNRELDAQIRKHREEMRELEENMEQAMKNGDEEARKELESQTKELKEEMKKLENEAEKLASDYRRAKQEMEDNLRRMEAKRREEAARYQKEIDELEEALKAAASDEERAQMEEKIKELEKKQETVIGLAPALLLAVAVVAITPSAVLASAIEGLAGIIWWALWL